MDGGVMFCSYSIYIYYRMFWCAESLSNFYELCRILTNLLYRSAIPHTKTSNKLFIIGLLFFPAISLLICHKAGKEKRIEKKTVFLTV